MQLHAKKQCRSGCDMNSYHKHLIRLLVGFQIQCQCHSTKTNVTFQGLVFSLDAGWLRAHRSFLRCQTVNVALMMQRFFAMGGQPRSRNGGFSTPYLPDLRGFTIDRDWRDTQRTASPRTKVQFSRRDGSRIRETERGGESSRRLLIWWWVFTKNQRNLMSNCHSQTILPCENCSRFRPRVLRDSFELLSFPEKRGTTW